MQTLATALGFFAIVMAYISVGVWTLHMRRPLAGGLTMAVISLLPLVLTPASPNSEVPGDGILPALMLMPSLVLIAVGLIAFAVRLSIRLLRQRKPSGLQKT